ncbi:Protein polybromo-1 [Cyphomyrmex costatus]|uniref:Protein polybromo-1 n=1 Tax=Cyphomyrmex costatus TaxID=456900 RepID=A0A151II05_9HYME|nr:Protein polybromo-1 [Cyphomyrmex costatus]
MNKRRRTSSVASRGTEDDGDDTPPEPTKRRKKLDPSDLCQQLYEILRNQKKEDGTLLCDAFIRVPKRRQEPGYYEVVSNPIDLLKVQQKLKTDEYRDMDDLAADIQLMVNNAKAFYMRTSPEYKDATELWELCLNTKNRIMEEYEEPEPKGKLILKVGRLARKVTVRQDDAEDTSESSTNLDEETMQLFEDLFAAVMTATDPTDNNRPLHIMFQLKPSKKLYPEYYDVIETPIDLKTIARKVQEGAYSSLGDMEKDLMLMCRNACQFNEPGSQIYKDAKLLKKIITAAARRQDSGFGSNIKIATTAPSTRSKRGSRTMAQSLIAQTASLRDEDDESDDEEEEPAETEEADNPQWQLFQTIRTAPNNQGIRMSEYFWKLPSKRLYPDYYKTIKNPISLLQIRTKIKKCEYGTVSEVAGDMNIMFENAKKYNMHTSRLYKCAAKLQKIMQEKVQELLEFDQDSDSDSESENSSQQPKLIKRASNLLTRGKYKDNIPLKKRLYALVKCVIEYVCEDGRQPMLMFMEKPSKKLYPDYYQVIAEPIDMLAIEANIKVEKYQNENELIQDFKLMFNNCRQYNEEGSLIYEDANTLEKVLMDKVKELGPLPDTPRSKSSASTPTRNVGRPKKIVPLHLQKLRTLYDTIKDYHDTKGRQLSLIFMKLPNKNEYPDYYEVIKQPIHMEKIASTLKNNGYDNLDELVSDFILMFDNACKYNEPDSQIYKVCEFDRVRVNISRMFAQSEQNMLNINATQNPLKMRPCFIRLLRDKELDKHTKRYKKTETKDALILQRLVLQSKLQLSEDEESVPDVSAAVQEILATIFTALYNHQDEEGRCYSDSMAELPEHDIVDGKKIRGLSLDLIKRRLDRGVYKRLDRFQEDVFTCLERARRLSRTDSQPFEDSVELQAFFLRTRDEMTRNVILYNPEDTENTYYEQYSTCAGSVKTGDFVYVATDGGRQQIAQVDAIWSTKDGKCYFKGPWLLMPTEVPHTPTKLFYKQELFLSTVDGTHPIVAIVGKCAVLDYGEYICSRPTEIPEDDVYICESLYDESKSLMKKLSQDGLKKFNHTSAVTEDEVYFFRRPINPAKVSSDVAQTQSQVKSITPSSAQFEMEASPLLPKLEPDVLSMGVGLGVGVGVGVGEDSMDAGGPPSVGSTEAQPVLSNTQTPVSTKKKTAGKKLVTGYILYSSKMRTQITQNNPESSFGEISRIVGNEWRKLPAGEKQAWEERAIKMNEDGGQLKGTTAIVTNATQDVVYECCWDNCDWQFEDMTDCIDHCIAEQNGHVQSSFANAPSDVEYQCQWRGCGRTKKSVPPFPSVQRLARHVKEVHILKSHGRIIPPSERSRNYMPSKGPTVLPPMETETSAAATQTSNLPTAKQPEPMFVAVPPTPSRVLHSDAYLRYIEGLNVENRYISNWDKQMNANPDNTQIPDVTKLPAEWLGNGVGNHGNVVNALWTLRNMMMRDVLAINKTL